MQQPGASATPTSRDSAPAGGTLSCAIFAVNDKELKALANPKTHLYRFLGTVTTGELFHTSKSPTLTNL